MATFSSGLQCGETAIFSGGSSIDISSYSKEPIDNFKMAAASSSLQCGETTRLRSSLVNVGSCRTEPLDNLKMTASSSSLQRRKTTIRNRSSS